MLRCTLKKIKITLCVQRKRSCTVFFIFYSFFCIFFFIISWSPLHTHTHSENVIWFISRRKHRVLFCFSNCMSFVIGRCCYNYRTYSRAHCAAWSWTYTFGIEQRVWNSFSFNCQLNFLLKKKNMVRDFGGYLRAYECIIWPMNGSIESIRLLFSVVFTRFTRSQWVESAMHTMREHIKARSTGAFQ